LLLVVKKLIACCLLFCTSIGVQAQYFLRGGISDDKKRPLQNVKILLHSSKQGYTTDHGGSFGIPSSLQYDSITVSLDGFEKQVLRVKTDVWQSVVLKVSAATLIKNKPKLISFTKDANRKQRFNPFVSDETYFKLVENEFVHASLFPNTAFSLNVNKASYSNVRRFINMKSKAPPDAVRVEEMVNYFNLAYEKPDGKDIFKIKSTITNCPWNKKNELLFIKLSAKKIELDKIPAGNFVFLIDVSGSMDMPNRLPLIKEAFQLFVKNLRPIDKVSIVTYGGMVGTWLAPTPGDEKQKISDRLELLEAAGDTPGESAIEAAYKMARSTFIPGGNNRVILATDGDFNVGQTSEKALDDLITRQRESGIFLTCLGVGMGNFKDSKLQTLAKRGNGNYAYLDDLHEAEKVLVQELTETLYAVADNAFINIQFNPSRVSSYRLIGFDNKREAVQDGSSDLDGGEIGSGSSNMAIFELTPVQNNNVLSTSDIGKLQLKFHDVKDKTQTLQQTDFNIQGQVKDTTDNAAKFGAAVAMYGLKLKQSAYINKASWTEVKAVAESAADKAVFLQTEFLKLLDKTIDVYEPSKKKKKKKKGEE
jgi:Ca-activated chloride channel homolog